jgi:hypothetical protein
MSGTILVGSGKQIVEMPRETWEQGLVGVPDLVGARLAFMTEEHHRVRNFVVEEIPRTGEPIRPEHISRELKLSRDRTEFILDELERHLFFLVRNQRAEVSWAFPVTAENTGHHLVFSTGERLDAA